MCARNFRLKVREGEGGESRRVVRERDTIDVSILSRQSYHREKKNRGRRKLPKKKILPSSKNFFLYLYASTWMQMRERRERVREKEVW